MSDKPRPSRVPVSTYRLQLNKDFPFSAALAQLDYLQSLGITDLYLSPILHARPGSVHGYDVVDHGRINPELGADDDFRALARAARDRNMGVIVDIVPNHMCVACPANTAWWDVLENGPSSPYSTYFDVDWEPSTPGLRNKVLLPVLGGQFGRVLESGEIRVKYENGLLYLTLYGNRLPMAPRSWTHLLEPLAARLEAQLGPADNTVMEAQSILTALTYLPEQSERDPNRVRERYREKEVVRRRFESLVQSSPDVQSILDTVIREVNGQPGIAASFDLLERLLNEQAYRLAFWRVAADEINYRRFFDINELAAIRVEDPVVFQAAHEVILRFISEGLITGLRVDHPDGLYDPAGYFEQLQQAVAQASPEAAPFYVVAEKILTHHEHLRPWCIEGTVGYGFLNLLNGLYVDISHRSAFERLYRTFTGSHDSYPDQFYDAKKLVLQVAMSSELNVLARRLDDIATEQRYSRDFTLENLRHALREVITCFPIYRTYIRESTEAPDREDVRHIRAAVNAARERNPALSEDVFAFIEDLLLLRDPPGLTAEQRHRRRLWVMRLQQFTGPVMARGLEDTLFYRYVMLASLNEVGGEPPRFGTPAAVFHERNAIRLRHWPNAMLASSTHDTKRGEDVRARISVLSEIPQLWAAAVHRWHSLNLSHRSRAGDMMAPSPNDEYLLYQTLIGTWPADPRPNGYEQRIQQYMLKAIREAKLHSSWIRPNAAYEEAVDRFLDAILHSEDFLADFARFQTPVAEAGLLNSLSQTVLKLTAPGVPDTYQGNEMPEFTLVDPDNRRAIDYQLRRDTLRALDEAAAPDDKHAKLWITSRLLRFRRDFHALFSAGAYEPIRATGPHRHRLIAFARTYSRQAAIAIAGRFFLSSDGGLTRDASSWNGTDLLLPRSHDSTTFIDVLTNRKVAAHNRRIAVSEAFGPWPVAVLMRENA
ncbi:MAG: malto-oligosyltrehalose synthase [Bryobacterales bacterium]|nr:malto-oligosyltrehalose synthase [Bryobacterales bacterium]